MIKLTAFRSLPPFAQGLARDFRVRWALEEARVPYEEVLIGPEDRRPPNIVPFNRLARFPPSRWTS